MAKYTVALTDAQEQGLEHVMAEQGQKDAGTFVQTTLGNLADDWCRRMCATDVQAVIARINADPDALADVKAALGIKE